MFDPMEVLRVSGTPVAPDPAFRAALRARLVDVLLAPIPEEPMTTTTESRNGVRHGDISYLTMGVRDVAKARAFYGPLLGWTFYPGDPSPRSSVRGVRPEMGIGEGDRELGVVLAYRVDDIAAAVAEIRARGGTATDPVQRPYAMEADCVDDQGIPFYLHQFDDGPSQAVALQNGAAQGDVAYITLGVPDLAAAQAFYGAVLDWTFSPGTSEHGRQVEGVTPMTGLWAGASWTGARLSYRVDDISAAVARVAALGGSAGPVEERGYGRACDDCVDDQGAPFMLLQLAR